MTAPGQIWRRDQWSARGRVRQIAEWSRSLYPTPRRVAYPSFAVKMPASERAPGPASQRRKPTHFCRPDPDRAQEASAPGTRCLYLIADPRSSGPANAWARAGVERLLAKSEGWLVTTLRVHPIVCVSFGDLWINGFRGADIRIAGALIVVVPLRKSANVQAVR
jgi:hypothetical protein